MNTKSASIEIEEKLMVIPLKYLFPITDQPGYFYWKKFEKDELYIFWNYTIKSRGQWPQLTGITIFLVKIFVLAIACHSIETN